MSCVGYCVLCVMITSSVFDPTRQFQIVNLMYYILRMVLDVGHELISLTITINDSQLPTV